MQYTNNNYYNKLTIFLFFFQKKKKTKTPKTTPGKLMSITKVYYISFTGGTRSESRGTKLSRSKLSVSRASSVSNYIIVCNTEYYMYYHVLY